MSSTAFFVGGVLPYAAVVAFLVGVVYRLSAWQRVPQPGLMTLYPTEGSGFFPLAKEALFFPSLYRGDKTLWALAWSFHVSLALAFVGHLRVVTGLLDRGLGIFGVGAEGMGALSALAGGAAGTVLIVTVVTLLVRRLLVARVREISTVPDFLTPLLLVAVITTGDLMRFGGTHLDLGETRTWVASLLTFSPVVPANPAFLLHAFFAELLILYFAFSKLMHFGGFFFTFSLVKRGHRVRQLQAADHGTDGAPQGGRHGRRRARLSVPRNPGRRQGGQSQVVRGLIERTRREAGAPRTRWSLGGSMKPLSRPDGP